MNQDKDIELITGLRQEVDRELLKDCELSVFEAMKAKLKHEIVDEESARQALSCCLQVRKLKNKVESSRKAIVRPHLDFQKAVMIMAKEIIKGFEAIEADFEKKVIVWMEEQKENPFTRIDEISVDDGSISCKTVLSYQIIDENVVPREFLAVDEKKVKEAMAKGYRNIPGLEITTQEAFALRVKN